VVVLLDIDIDLDLDFDFDDQSTDNGAARSHNRHFLGPKTVMLNVDMALAFKTGVEDPTLPVDALDRVMPMVSEPDWCGTGTSHPSFVPICHVAAGAELAHEIACGPCFDAFGHPTWAVPCCLVKAGG
jgi:hypothetical protein